MLDSLPYAVTAENPHRHHRRRRHRVQHRLSPRQARRSATCVLLERLQLTHGATWHAAGLVGQLRSSSNLTRLMRYGAELYGKLEAETGQATGWQRRRAACASRRRPRAGWSSSAPRRWPRASASTSSSCRPQEARELFPLLDLDGVDGAAWIEGDGYVDPASLTKPMRRARGPAA